MLMSKVLAQFRDDHRVQNRFERVESRLRQRDVSSWPIPLQTAREVMLGKLRVYRLKGVFPRNYDHSGYRPAFIDRHGRVCAVACLMIQSGQAPLAHHLAKVANDAFVSEISLPEFDQWAAQSGLTKEELAVIQPSYHCIFHPDQFPYALYHVNGVLTGLLNLLYLASASAIFSWLFNGIAWVRRRRNSLAIGLGLVAGVALIALSLLYFQAIQTHAVDIRDFLSIASQPSPGWQPCLVSSRPLLTHLQKVLAQDSESFRNFLIGLGGITLATSFLVLFRRRKDGSHAGAVG